MHSRDNSISIKPHELPSSRRRFVAVVGDDEAHSLSVSDVQADRGMLPDTEFLLSALRVATLRARLAANELDMIGVALKRGLVSYDDAVAWLHDIDLLDQVAYRPANV